MDRVIWSLKTTSNWSVQMIFLILETLFKLLLSKSGKPFHVTLVQFLRYLIFLKRKIELFYPEFCSEILVWHLVGYSLVGVLNLVGVKRWSPDKITGRNHKTHFIRSCGHWSYKQQKAFFKKEMFFFSMKFYHFSLILYLFNKMFIKCQRCV